MFAVRFELFLEKKKNKKKAENQWLQRWNTLKCSFIHLADYAENILRHLDCIRDTEKAQTHTQKIECRLNGNMHGVQNLNSWSVSFFSFFRFSSFHPGILKRAD